MIDILFCLVLIMLGALAAESFFKQTVKPLAKLIDKLEPYSPLIGLIGLFCGFIWLMETISLARHFSHQPLATVILWIYSIMMLTLGLIFGHEVVSKIIGEPSPSYVLRFGEWRVALLPYQTKLGLAGILMGFAFILHFFLP